MKSNLENTKSEIPYYRRGTFDSNYDYSFDGQSLVNLNVLVDGFLGLHQ